MHVKIDLHFTNPLHFYNKCTPFIVSTTCTKFINADIKGASPNLFLVQEYNYPENRKY